MAIKDYWRSRTDASRLAAASLAAVAASIVLDRLSSDAFGTVLGIARPVGPVVAVVVLGFVGWLVLSRRSWIPGVTEGLAGYRLAVLIGLALPIPVIVVDWMGGFERGINAPAPDSLLFYPSIVVVAEFVFHVAPLSAAAILALLFGRAERAFKLVGLSAAVAIEPILQIIWGAGRSPAWASVYVGVQLVVFNVIGVYLLLRFGILRALLYRLSYYVVWHILWGYLRLELLFTA